MPLPEDEAATEPTDAPGAALVAAVLVTGPGERVVLVPDRDAPGGWALPGGVPAAGQSPRCVAARAVAAVTGLTPRVGWPLVLDWANGRVYQVLDGGEASSSACRRIGASGAVFATAAQLPERVGPVAARRITAALRAREHGRIEYLEGGHTPIVLAVMRRYGIEPWVHSGSAWTWHDGPVPEGVPVRHSWVWLFAPDGRVVVYVDVDGKTGLPGGTLEDFDRGDPVAAAVREVREETQMEMTDPVHLGYLLDEQPGRTPVARARLAATISAVGPSAIDPATGTVHRRLLVPPRLIAELCGWGPRAAAQTEAAIKAAWDLGLTEPPPDAGVSEIPADGSGVLP